MCFRKVQLWPIYENISKLAGSMLSDLKDTFDDPLLSLVYKASGTSTHTCFKQFPQFTAINSWKDIYFRYMREGELGENTIIALDLYQRY